MLEPKLEAKTFTLKFVDAGYDGTVLIDTDNNAYYLLDPEYELEDEIGNEITVTFRNEFGTNVIQTIVY